MKEIFTQITTKRARSHDRSTPKLSRLFETSDIQEVSKNSCWKELSGLSLKSFIGLTLLLCINFLLLNGVSAQTTETFESFSLGATSFTSGGTPFTLNPSSGFKVDVYSGYGYLSSNNFVDNMTGNPNPCQIKSTSIFSVKSLYLYPSTYAGGDYNQTSSVNVTFTGKLASVTKFTYSPPSSDFASASWSNATNRGFSLVNFATPGYDNIAIDELEVTLGGSTIYFAIDNFTWGTAVVNNAPTDIALSASSINENVAGNSTVGALSSTDPDAGNTFTYTLVSGTGSTDNASFNISGSSLRITNSPDYETKSSYSVRVRTTDQGSLYYEKAFTITINDLNEAPTDVSLSASTINENVAGNSTVGTLSSTDQDAGNTFTYTLVSGTGSTDNASFNISGSSLRITSSPDFETKSSYSVRIRSTDQGSLYYEKAFTITINDVNETPTDISLSPSSVNENVAGNTSVGTLSSTDPDAGNTFTYTLVAGTGSTDNASFNISGSSLRITSSPDFETKSSYSVRVRTTDQGTLYYEKAFTITINDVNETPTDISLSASSVNENVAGNTSIGSLSSTDPDAGNTFTYTLVAGTGSTDNASFNISGSSLRITNTPDFETKSSYSVRVRTTDQGTLYYEKAFTITINDLNETPTDISLSASSVNENVAGNTSIGTLSSTDPDAGNTFTYTLVAGTGSTDNASFNISGSSLRITNSPDFETKSSYSIRIRSTDQGSLNYEKVFAITINNVNETPTDISLSASSVNENVAGNTSIGTLSSTDPDAGNTFTYTLVAGSGSTDNASFNISGSSLRITNSPDFEAKSSYSVRIRTTDQGSLTYEEAFTITISNLNETPTDISLSSNSVDENVAGNTVVGALSSTDPDAGNTFTYTLVIGSGDTDNASFNISGSNLQITNSPNFEAKSSYSVRVRTTDQGSLTFEKEFTITINDLNEAPTNVSLSANAVDENVAGNTVVGALSSTDPDAGNTFVYTLVVGSGDTDNIMFNINGNNLEIINSPDFETKNSYSVRIRTTDQGSLTFEKEFTITINDLNETPTDISLSANSVDENVAGNTVVGALSSTDPDASNTFTYTLVAGSGDTDNASFNISGSNLQITNSPDFEAKSSYSVRIRTTDQGSLFYEKIFTVTINDLNETPTDISLSSSSIDENVAGNSTVGTLSSTDQDAGNTFAYTLVTGTGDTDNSSFSISGNELHIISSPDYETKSSYSVLVRSTDQGDLYFEKSFTISINDVNENSSVTASQSFNIDENSIVGTVVGTVSATDPDAGTTFSSWTITANVNPNSNGAEAFAINSTTGQITVLDAEDLDRESNSSFTIKVTVSDGTNTSAEESVTINLNDVNDIAPVITASQVLYVTEQSPNGTTVGTVVATDGDVTATTFQNWTITAGNTGGYFAINSSTGVITVVDNTGLNSNINQSFTLTLTVSDGVNTSQSQTVSIIVSAINDENPVVTPNQSFAIDENSANSTIVGNVLATDPDYGTNFQNWAITDGNTDNAFAINSSSGQITVVNSTALDYEVVTSFSLTIQVSDGLHAASGVVTVNLDNLNDNAPTINSGTFAIDENSANGTSIGTIVAGDPDGALNSLTFSIITATKGSDPFAVNLSTGEVTVSNSTLLDYESIQSYSITIRISDGIHNADGVFTINLNNLNDNAPEVTNSTFAIDENSANATAVGTVTATDADGALNSLTYSITAGNINNGFAINSSTGAITVSNVQALDFETTPTFTLTVNVSDGVNSTNGTITINLNDLIDTGIEDNREFSFNVYPNPANNKVNISLNNPTSDNYTIEIVRIDGVKMHQSNQNILFGVKTIDLTGISSGVYFIKVYNSKTMLTNKLIVK